MNCRFCVCVGQFFLNFANLLDHAFNFFLLGDPNETISSRVARARVAGRKWAGLVCKFLSFATKVVTFGKLKRDHCDYALDGTIHPNSREIFSLTTMSFNNPPISEVVVEENITLSQ